MPQSEARDVPGPARTHTVKLSGFVGSLQIAAALRRCDEAIERDATIQSIVLDVLEIEGFEPGVPARVIQWLGANAQQVRCGVLVTTSPVLIATVRASGLLLNETAFLNASSRSEGQAIALQMLTTRPRSMTGLRATKPTTDQLRGRKASG